MKHEIHTEKYHLKFPREVVYKELSANDFRLTDISKSAMGHFTVYFLGTVYRLMLHLENI